LTTRTPILTLDDLKTYFFAPGRVVKAVDGVSLELGERETVGIVGESGSGKSATFLSVLGLIPPPGRIVGGKVLFEGRSLLELPPRELRAIRGKQIGMIFQDPMTSLNPFLTIGDQLIEPLVVHDRLSKSEARRRAAAILEKVGIPEAAARLNDYPHRFSGGMRQRVMIAMALSCNPHLLIADEPTTALDVTIQAQILELLNQLKAELGMAVMLITHDLGVVADTAARVAVMYAGRVVEQAPVLELFTNPLHPYTQGLLNSIPRIEKAERRPRLQAIPGMVPDLLDLPRGCKFQARCTKVFDACRGDEPQLKAMGSANHIVRCCLY